MADQGGLLRRDDPETFIEIDQGCKSISPARRDLEAIVLDGKLCHGDNAVLNMCASNAVIEMDPAGNRKLNKKRSGGRMDGMAAEAESVPLAPAGQGLSGAPSHRRSKPAQGRSRFGVGFTSVTLMVWTTPARHLAQ